METVIGNKQVKCFICEEEFSKSSTQSVYVGNKVYKFCNECAEEFSKSSKHIIREIESLKRRRINKWIKERRSVKRFYKNQMSLPLEEVEQNEVQKSQTPTSNLGNEDGNPR